MPKNLREYKSPKLLHCTGVFSTYAIEMVQLVRAFSIWAMNWSTVVWLEFLVPGLCNGPVWFSRLTASQQHPAQPQSYLKPALADKL